MRTQEGKRKGHQETAFICFKYLNYVSVIYQFVFNADLGNCVNFFYMCLKLICIYIICQYNILDKNKLKLVYFTHMESKKINEQATQK